MTSPIQPMTTAQVIELISAITTATGVILGFVTQFILTLRNHDAIQKNTQLTQQTKDATDGMTHALVEATDAAARAEGKAEGHAEERAESKI